MNPPVLFVGNFLSSSRLYRLACEELADRLTQREWTILTTSTMPQPALRLFDMVSTIVRRRRDYRAAAVDVFSGNAFVWAETSCRVLKRLGKPYTLTLRGGNLPVFARTRKSRVSRLLCSAHTVTAPSGYLREHMAPYRPELALLPNAIDIRAYPFRCRETASPDLVWLRAFHSIYNPSLAPRVAAALRSDFPAVRLMMVGPDKGDGSLQKVRETASLAAITDRMEYTAGVPKSEVPSTLNRGDIFLNTTNIDNTPISVLEALACGLCVVSTNVDGLPYLLTDQKDGLLVPPDNVDAMASAVRRILTERGLARHLSENARAQAQSHDWTIVLPQWEALLQSLALAT